MYNKLPQELCDNTYHLGSALAPMNGFGPIRYDCFACGHQWEIARDENWRLPEGYWKCPHGCNELLTEGAHSTEDVNKGLRLLSAYLTGYMERDRDVNGTTLIDPNETIDDFIEEVGKEKPAWMECLAAVYYLLNRLVIHDPTKVRVGDSAAARRVVHLIATYIIFNEEGLLCRKAA